MMAGALLFLAFAQAEAAPETCPAESEQVAALVTVRGLRAPSGLLVVYLYDDDPRRFLQHGQSIRRIELPVTSRDAVRLCLVAPRTGRYAVTARHDVDGDRRRLDPQDGGGFSRNPRLSLARLRPRLSDVLIELDHGVTPVELVLNYRYGLRIRPADPVTPLEPHP